MRPIDHDYQNFANLLKKDIVAWTTMVHQMHAALRVEQLFKSLATSAPLGLAFWTRKRGATFEPTWKNDAWLELLGIADRGNPTIDMTVQKEAVPAAQWGIRSHPNDVKVIQECFQALQKGSTASPIELRVLRKGCIPTQPDAYRWILLFSSLHDHEGSGTASIGSWALDITDSKKTAELQDQRLKDAEKGKVEAESFIDMVSHELRNPMSAIMQYADSIRRTAETLAMSRRISAGMCWRVWRIL